MSDTSVSAEIVVLEASPEEVLIVTIAERGADGASDHGLLSGLADDDHLQYHNDARGDARYAAIAHASDTANPHAVTAAQAGADATGTAATLIAAHEIAPDPHSVYPLESDLGTAAFLDVGTTVGDVVQVQTGGKLPALDGSLLTGLPGVGDLTEAAADLLYAPIAKGVTNGDAHDHNGGDGAQIAYAALSGLPT
ncbi:MAG: hypothetical protein IPO73_19195, partial [Gemmatimonadetes bacterium]|nr:hypothetical protein [Gemmatimonadota bacterium]